MSVFRAKLSTAPEHEISQWLAWLHPNQDGNKCPQTPHPRKAEVLILHRGAKSQRPKKIWYLRGLVRHKVGIKTVQKGVVKIEVC